MTVSSLAAGFLGELRLKRRMAIKRLAKKTGKRPEELLVLQRASDPFYVGSKDQYAKAEWARGLFNLHGTSRPVHIRRLHYFALAQPQHKRPDGNVYANTTSDWRFLLQACKCSRYLNILPYDLFIDRRAPHTNCWTIGNHCSDIWKDVMRSSFEQLYYRHVRLMLSEVMPVHIEIWSEKSTAADLLEPITNKYNIPVTSSMGDISITSVWQFFKRVANCGKPVRIFYISDFDPSGANMPISVSRKIEYFIRQMNLSRKLDIKLKPIMLTRTQVRRFQLPSVPLKSHYSKSGSFSKYYGKMATELHALEVKRPGHLCSNVERYMQKYLDLKKIAKASKLAKTVLGRLFQKIEKLIENDNNLNAVFDLAAGLMEDNSFISGEIDEQWLLDSKRDYMTQLLEY